VAISPQQFASAFGYQKWGETRFDRRKPPTGWDYDVDQNDLRAHKRDQLTAINKLEKDPTLRNNPEFMKTFTDFKPKVEKLTVGTDRGPVVAYKWVE
jgi:hypothetical protein